jgi:hypothetical protein
MNLENLIKLTKGGRFPLCFLQNNLFFDIIKNEIHENNKKRVQPKIGRNK